MASQVPGARQEWAVAWPLPFTAMFGISGAAIFAYSSGVFMESITGQFGWSRAQYSLGFMLQMVAGLIAQPLAGRLADRFGPRRVAMIGIFPAMIGLSLLGTVGQLVWEWWALVVLQGVCNAMIIPAIWITAVVGRFDAGRGLALAVALAGIGLAAALWPPLAAVYIHQLGWRLALPALAATWGVIALPLTFAFMRGPRDLAGAVRPLVRIPGPASPSGFALAMRSPTFVCLTLAGGLYAVISLGYSVHMIPLMRHNGLSMGAAATVAGIAGLFSIAGRIGAGFLLDRLPTRPLGVVVFLLPVLIAALLSQAGTSMPMYIIAVALLGIAGGAETDIVFYIAAREFAPESYASIASMSGAFFACCASVGPVLAGVIFDRTGGYGAYLIATCPLAIAGSLLIAFMPSQRKQDASA